MSYRQLSQYQVFTEEVSDLIPQLTLREGIAPASAELDTWPKMNATLEGILALNRLNNEQKQEWILWFAQAPQVLSSQRIEHAHYTSNRTWHAAETRAY